MCIRDRNKDKTTKKGQSAGSLEEAIDYAMNRDKTERSIFEDAIGCEMCIRDRSYSGVFIWESYMRVCPTTMPCS